MIIDKKIFPVSLQDFRIGKISVYPGSQMIFLFDTHNPQLVQLNHTFEILQRIDLRKLFQIQSIDSVLFDSQYLLISDFLHRKIYRFHTSFHPSGLLQLTPNTPNPSYQLNQGSIINAASLWNNKYLLLDKGYSLIRVFDSDFSQEITIGSRMGYLYDSDYQENLRLGFEFPEDIAVINQQIIVSDSGNKRLVVLDSQFKQQKVIPLPKFPFKIIAALGQEDDIIIVSDFDSSLMAVSLKYQYIHTYEAGFPADFYPSVYHSSMHLVSTETPTTCEIAQLIFQDISIPKIAQEANNNSVLMKICLDQKDDIGALKYVETYPQLLPQYVTYASSPHLSIQEKLKSYIVDTFQALSNENEQMENQLSRFSIEFIKKYKSIPGSDDIEAANIEKENVLHRMLLIIKNYRANLRKLSQLQNLTRNFPHVMNSFSHILSERLNFLQSAIHLCIKNIKENLGIFDEQKMVEYIAQYWWRVEEEKVLFKNHNPRISYEILFGKKFLLAILNDFYFNLSQLFLKQNKIEQYIAFADHEITMYPDKIGIFNQFAEQLINLSKYDEVIRMLKKIPDQDKENVNYFYYRIAFARKQMEVAFLHLKKELDLYHHRVDLIPRLIELNMLKEEEARKYIDNMLEKSAHSIDACLFAAQSFHHIQNHRLAEFYVDKELEFFPENKKAVLFKHKLFSQRLDSSEFSFDEEYLKKIWEMFKTFIKMNPDEVTALQVISFFSVLNYLQIDDTQFKVISNLIQIACEPYKRELKAYLSFSIHFKHIQVEDIPQSIQSYSDDLYLSSYSTRWSAYTHYFQQAKQFKSFGQWEEMFSVLEVVLRYFPADKVIFNFLDELAGIPSVQ